jgi:predicted phosphodiesterase
MKKIEVIASYRDKYGWDMPTKKLARIIVAKEPLLFDNIETVRGVLTKIEGKANTNGTKVRKEIDERPKNPYKLPESYNEDRKPLILPKSCNNILVISDLHIPYHDINAVTIAMKYGIDNKVNTIFINGDLMDFHGLSRFEKDPRKRSVKDEFDATKQFLIALREAFPTQEIYWLKGNHCIRYEKWLMTKVYEVFDDEYYHLEQRLALNDQRIKLIDDKVLVKIGKLAITHGHHVMRGFFAPVNSARGAWMKAKQSVLIGHVHKVSNHVEVNLDGHSYGCWSTGSLCELKPDYSPLASNYQHGFAHVIVEDSGDFSVKNHQIINGRLH